MKDVSVRLCVSLDRSDSSQWHQMNPEASANSGVGRNVLE